MGSKSEESGVMQSLPKTKTSVCHCLPDRFFPTSHQSLRLVARHMRLKAALDPPLA
jgi:hypothetical protein